MLNYIARRIVWALLVMVAVATISFLLTFVAPGDPARAIGGLRATAEAVETIRHALGLDRPMLEQLFDYFGRVLQGDFGHSFKQDAEVLDLIVARFPATAQLALAGLGVSLAIGLPIGVRSALRPGGRVDRLGGIVTAALVAAPPFWVGYMLQYGLAFVPKVRAGIDVFAITGYEPFDLHYLALPALTLGVGGAAYYARITRTAMLDELGLDYIRTARAKGLGERTVAWRHALRNALPPILSQIGLDLGFFLGGVVVIEQVFSWPGIGKLALDAIPGEDLPLLMGTVLFATMCVVLANLVVDLVQAAVDPRISHAERSR